MDQRDFRMQETQHGDTAQFEFRGSAGEWFGIWIINLLLTAVTFGIYSAWAKVRRKKYFYNNTYVAGRNFDYHATGKQILIGRLIFIGGYIALSLTASFNPILALVFIGSLLFIIPWLIVKSIQFNARMSSFSNVRFNFTGKTGRAFVVYVLLPIAAYVLPAACTFGAAYLRADAGNHILAGLLIVIAVVIISLAFPIIDRAAKQFTVSHHRLGGAEFEFQTSLSPFLKAIGAAFGWVVLTLVGIAVFFGVGIVDLDAAFASIASGSPTPADFTIIGALYIGFFIAILPAGYIYQAMIRNVVFNETTLTGGHRFRSTVSAPKLLWIAVSNAVLTIISLGLLLPWTHVRLQNYMARQTYLLPGESLDNFVDQQIEQGYSVADAYSDMEGLDFGMPL